VDAPHGTDVACVKPGSEPTRRELEVLANALAHSTKGTAYRLGISEQAVKNHLTSLFRRLGAVNRDQAGIALGWILIPDGLLRDEGGPRSERVMLPDADEAGAIQAP